MIPRRLRNKKKLDAGESPPPPKKKEKKKKERKKEHNIQNTAKV
jgi:hypothetical protein